MSLAHQSIATISSPQFINLQTLDINPLMSSCQIKVLYIGKNRNGSFISKEVATEMAKTLRGAPIVGYYKENKEDFADHGQQVIFDDEGIHFNCLTKPYGFVAPNAQVWFQDFEDTDDFNNTITRTYLMTTGYLWTGQFEQAQKVIDQGRPHSMEIDDKTLQGKWSTDVKDNMDFFIINDAIFSKLCILGDDVEPCFEGSAITAPQVSASFTVDQNFKTTLFKMMNQLKYALEGGNMAEVKDMIETPEVSEEFVENQDNTVESFSDENNIMTEEDASLDFVEDSEAQENVDSSFEKKDDENNQDDKDDTQDADEDEDKDDEDEDNKKKFTALKEELEVLKANFEKLQNEAKELRAFKLNVENVQKDDLISQFYMLSEEDKKDVIENKSSYTLDEIKAKLAVICFEKKVNFSLEDSSENNKEMKETESPVTTFNVETKEDSIPDWVREVESTMNGN